MRVEDAATGNEGVWITFLAVTVLYVGLAVTTVLVLRGMSRRWRAAEAAGGPGDGLDEAEVPYGPNAPPSADGARPMEEVTVR
jgi:cytochrome d ubiquinol oxidase subunit I